MFKARIVVVAIAAAAALTACSQPVQQIGSPDAGPAPVGSGSPESKRPVETKPEERKQPKPKKSAEERKPEWTRVDFAGYMFGSMNCPKNEYAKGKAEITAKKFADLTGDGTNEAIIVAKCITGIGNNSVVVEVLEGAHTRWPKSLLVVGARDHDDLVSVKIRTSGRNLTLTSLARSVSAARCCPDRLVVEEFRWTDGKFERIRHTYDPA